MANVKRWTQSGSDGVLVYALSAWKHFAPFVNQVLLDYGGYIYRGQAAADWKLEPTLDRLLRKLGKQNTPATRNRHLERFKMAARGRRGPNPPRIESENDWWALGQHHGLSTPLLDWTSSPFVAAYFAFAEPESDGSPRRAIWALHQGETRKKSKELQEGATQAGRPPVVGFVSPMLDENARLVSQGGLFTRAPDDTDIEAWVRKNFAKSKQGALLKITIPNKDRELALRNLNRMNINHLSLFPDLYGASRYCNLDLLIPGY